MSRHSKTIKPWKLVFHTELLGLLRDRRAMFAGLILPALLYPFMFLGQGWLGKIAEETLNTQEVHVAMDLSAASPQVQGRLAELLALQIPIQVDSLPPGSGASIDALVQEATPDAWQRERELAISLIGTDGHLVLYAVPDPVVADRTLFRLHFDGARETSREARKRTNRALSQLSDELRSEFMSEQFGGDPAQAFVSEDLDLASEEDLSGALLGKLLPLIAVLVLLSGGSYAALAAFAGERESGTLETLLVQPVESIAIVRGKFLAVLSTSLATLVLNTMSLLLCVALGLGDLPGGGGAAATPQALRVLLGGLILIPVCLFLVSVLCLVCGKARSFREGQHYILPLSLVMLLPAAVAMQPDVQLDAFLACIPIAGPALAFREAMVGNLSFLPGFLAVFSTLLYSTLVLRRVGGLLDAEKILGSEAGDEELKQRRVQSRSALTWGWAGVLSVYLVGGLLQSVHPIGGLAATLWLLLPFLTWACVRRTAERSGESLPVALGLRLPAIHHLVGALLAAAALARFATVWIAWQQKVMPLPSSITSAGLPTQFTELSPLLMFLALALSPGICEELFFRGAVLSGLKRDLKAWKVVAWQALLFGAVHASIYRFAPTALIGGLAAIITLRSRSLFPAMLLHITYNGVLVLGQQTLPFFVKDSPDLLPSEAPPAMTLEEVLNLPWVPWLAIPALVLFAIPRRR